MSRLALTAALLATACFQPTTVSLGSDDAGPPPNAFTLQGEVCTPLMDPLGFSLRIVLVVEQSGGMCVFDPPGSQPNGSYCADALTRSMQLIPTEPARAKVLKRLVTALTTVPSASVAMVPFADHLQGNWPAGGGFGFPADPQVYASLMARINSLQAELGLASDYRTPLESALAIIEDDVRRTEVMNPVLLARTRYLVLFVASGLPRQRCAANDALPAYATPASPDLPYADADPLCAPGEDRNQAAQLVAVAARMAALKEQHRLGDVKLHTLQLFDRNTLGDCGALCTEDPENPIGPLAGIGTGDRASAALALSERLMQRLAEAGGGTYLSANSRATQKALLQPFDLTPLDSPFVLKSLIVEHASGVPSDTEALPDSDYDGVADSREPQGGRDRADTDGDCFDDNFEQRYATYGFDPDVKDPRGCDPQSPLTLNCVCRDTDGDGLSQFAEDYLGTSPIFVDTDADGIPDGVEVRNGLDPFKPGPLQKDSDRDGVTDAAEVRGGSNPLAPDEKFQRLHPVQYTVEPRSLADGRTCYAFTVSGLRLSTPQGPNVKTGFNLLRVWAGAAPELTQPYDYGVWTEACAWAQYVPPTTLVPADGMLSIPSTGFQQPALFTGPYDLWRSRCTGNPP